jgi:hypothetical protein
MALLIPAGKQRRDLPAGIPPLQTIYVRSEPPLHRYGRKKEGTEAEV